jgi:hypothetical protein
MTKSSFQDSNVVNGAGKREKLTKNPINCLFGKFRRSRRALAIPMTFLILFVSTLGLISVTYFFAVEKVNARSQILKISMAKQDFINLDENIMSIVWQSGSARTFDVADSGGKLCVQPNATSLEISITDNQDLNETVFNQITGQITYQLPYSESPETGLFLKGDSRTITNQSGGLITQLCIRSGAEHPEILLRYRPAISYTVSGTEDDKPVNNLRLYVVNLNGSDPVDLYGELPLKISCASTQMTTATYNLVYSPGNLVVTSVLGGTRGQVSVPISTNDNGAIINVETVVCNVNVERCLR